MTAKGTPAPETSPAGFETRMILGRVLVRACAGCRSFRASPQNRSFSRLERCRRTLTGLNIGRGKREIEGRRRTPGQKSWGSVRRRSRLRNGRGAVVIRSGPSTPLVFPLKKRFHEDPHHGGQGRWRGESEKTEGTNQPSASMRGAWRAYGSTSRRSRSRAVDAVDAGSITWAAKSASAFSTAARAAAPP